MDLIFVNKMNCCFLSYVKFKKYYMKFRVVFSWCWNFCIETVGYLYLEPNFLDLLIFFEELI